MRSTALGAPSNANPYISPKYRANDWQALKLLKTSSADWQVAVDMFHDRIHGRFLAPVEAIISHPDSKIQEFSGFAILAIDCLLVETLNQFHKGTDETEGSHQDAFWDFFSKSRFFRTEFDTKKKAQIFYGHFRCGILHQAQTKKLSKVRIGMPAMVQPTIPNNIDEGLTIDRGKFHQALIDEIIDYMQRLRAPVNREDHVLRESFVTKMSFIAGCQPTSPYPRMRTRQ